MTEISRLISALRLIDIGTDHGLLPIYALEQGIVSKAIGGDKSNLALSQARMNRVKSAAADDLELLCSDGLEKIILKEGDCVVLAGMGGLSMTQILDDPKVSECSQIITQANADVPLVRKFLSERGWKIEAETMIWHQKHRYVTISWRKGEQKLTEKEIALGKILLQERPELWIDWLTMEIKRMQKIQKTSRELFPYQYQYIDWLKEEIALD